MLAAQECSVFLSAKNESIVPKIATCNKYTHYSKLYIVAENIFLGA